MLGSLFDFRYFALSVGRNSVRAVAPVLNSGFGGGDGGDTGSD